MVLTVNTDVADEQVKFEILATRPRPIEQLVGYVYLTLTTSGALRGGLAAHVGPASNVAVLGPDTAPVLHPTVDGVRDDDHLVLTGTACLERLPLTKLTLTSISRRHFHAPRQHCVKQWTGKT